MSAPLGIKAGCGLLPLAHTSTSLRPAPALPALRRRAGGAAFNATAADQLAEALEAAVLPALEGLVSASVGVLVDAGVVAGEARRGWEAHRHKEPPHPRSPLISGADEAQSTRFVEVVQAVVAAGRPDSMPPQDARRPPPGPERPAAGSHGRALLQGGTPQPPAGLAPLTELASTIDTEDLSSPLPFYAALLQPALAWVLQAASQGNAAAAAARQQLLAELAAALAPLVEQVHRCTETGRHPPCLPACGGSPCRPHRPASLPSAAHRCSMPPPTRSMLWWREWRMCMCRRPPPKQAGRRGAAGVCGRGREAGCTGCAHPHVGRQLHLIRCRFDPPLALPTGTPRQMWRPSCLTLRSGQHSTTQLERLPGAQAAVWGRMPLPCLLRHTATRVPAALPVPLQHSGGCGDRGGRARAGAAVAGAAARLRPAAPRLHGWAWTCQP